MIITLKKISFILSVVMLTLLTGGCGQYVLKGKVISGPTSRILIVEADDPQLAGPPVGGATIQGTIDPQSLDRHYLPTTSSGPNGNFQLTTDVTGAGFLEYNLQVLGRAEKHNSAIGTVSLPSSSKRLLIILARGRDTFIEEDDPMRQAKEMLHE